MKKLNKILTLGIISATALFGGILLSGCKEKKDTTPPPANAFIEYSADGKTLLKCSTDITGDVVIKDGVETIAEEAFKNCDNMTTITFPSTIKTIGNSAFYDCDGIIELNIGGNLTIGNRAFANCGALRVVKLNEGVKSIGARAFEGSKYISRITLPSSLYAVGECAFEDCENISKVNFLGTDDQWCGIDFEIEQAYNPVYTSNPLFYTHKLYINNEEVTSIDIQSGIIKEIAFIYVYNLTEVNVSGLRFIGKEAFYGCKNLSKINLGSSSLAFNATIGKNAFAYCSNLTALYIPTGVDVIEMDIVSNSGNATTKVDIYCGDSKDQLGWADDWAQMGGSVDIHYSSGGFYFDEYGNEYWLQDFYGYEAQLVEAAQTDNIVIKPYIKENYYVNTIKSKAFYKHRHRTLRTVILPETLATIEANAFWGSFNYLNSITFIESYSSSWKVSKGDTSTTVSVENPETNVLNLISVYEDYKWQISATT